MNIKPLRTLIYEQQEIGFCFFTEFATEDKRLKITNSGNFQKLTDVIKKNIYKLKSLYRLSPVEAIETYRYQIFGVQQQKKTYIGKNEKIEKSKFCEITESQPKKHKLFN